AAVAIEDLTPFQRLAGRPLAGGLSLRLQGSATSDALKIDATIDGTLNDLEIGQAELDRLLQGQTTLSAEIGRNGAAFTLPSLAVENPQITVSGNGTYSPERGDVDARIAMSDLSQVVPELQGPGTVVVKAAGRSGVWDVDLDAEAQDIAVTANAELSGLDQEVKSIAGEAELRLADLERFSRLAGRDLGGAVTLTVEGSGTSDAARADLTFAGTTTSLRIDQPEADRLLAGTTALSGRVIKQGADIRLPEFQLSNPQITAEAQGSYAGDGSAIQAEVSLPDLGRIRPELSGPGRATVVAEQVGSIWQVSVDAAGAGATLDAVGEVSDVGRTTPTVTGRAALAANDLSRFSRLAGRTIGGSVDVTMNGSARIDGGVFDLDVDATGQGLQVGQEDADRLLAGRMQLNASVAREGADAPITVRRFALQSPAITASAQGQVLGGASNLELSVRLADVAPYAEGISGPVSLSGTVGEAGDALQLNISGQGPGGTTLRVSGGIARSFGSA
ncbi:hypothetical protein LCGC14_2483860, partial [marine sediment metagenome]